VELRDIEIFLTLAEELHFGRTAERLHVTPARVSQAIKKQERRIGAPLFDRTSRSVRLTTVGQQLHKELSSGYQKIVDGIRNVAAAAGGVGGPLTIGAMGAQPMTVGHVLDLLEKRHPTIEVQFRDIPATAPLDDLRAGKVDAALIWLPLNEPDLTVSAVTYTSPIVLMIGATHPLAVRQSVSWEDLGDYTVLTGTAVPASMEETFHPRYTPAGRPIPRGPAVSGWHDQMNLVASGRIVCGVAAEAARFYPWPSIKYLPISDAQPCRWAFAWRTANESPLITALAQAAADAGIA
jgi:DNA-binding transcriptional LysR family regulator